MNKEFLNRILQCNQCSSDNLDFNNVSFKSSLKPEGKIICNSCNSKMHFYDGVLIIDKVILTSNQKRNAYVYSDFWERSGQVIKYDRLTHEDELLASWRREFSEGVLLDAGCGSGRHLIHWTQPDVKADSFIMVDISDSIFQCRQFYEELKCKKPILFIQSAICNMPIKEKTISNTWSSGVVGLIDDQQGALKKLLLITKKHFFFGVLSEKTIAGKLYIAANCFKPILNKINKMSILFIIALFVAKIVLNTLKILNWLNITLSFIRKDHLINIVEDPKSVTRLQHSIYDPIIIPKIIKHKDSDYINWANQSNFTLKTHQTEIICDYFHFEGANE